MGLTEVNPTTHWKQTVWFMDREVQVDEGGTVEGKVCGYPAFSQLSPSRRSSRAVWGDRKFFRAAQVTMYPNQFNKRSVDIAMEYTASGMDGKVTQTWAFNGA